MPQNVAVNVTMTHVSSCSRFPSVPTFPLRHVSAGWSVSMENGLEGHTGPF